MALATQCPHCHTTFRVAHDQLKLRAGLVRCGACKQIFNGIENLLRPEELEQSSSRPHPAVPPPRVETPATRDDDIVKPAAAAPALPDEETISPAEPPRDATAATASSDQTEPRDTEAKETAAGHEPETRKNDPLLRMTLMDFAHERRESAEDKTKPASRANEDDGIEQAIDDLERKPWRREQDEEALAEGDALDRVEAAEYEEPSFVKQGRRKQRIGRALQIFMAVVSVLLLLGLLAQSAYVFRDQLAARFPQLKPALAQGCAYLGCQVGLPSDIESVSIESSELQTLSAESSTFVLTVLLRNHGATEQAWPYIELTLNDGQEKPIARRVFQPREYLPAAQDMNTGFAARTEQPVKLYFELAQLKASGYRVYLFYP